MYLTKILEGIMSGTILIGSWINQIIDFEKRNMLRRVSYLFIHIQNIRKRFFTAGLIIMHTT